MELPSEINEQIFQYLIQQEHPLKVPRDGLHPEDEGHFSDPFESHEFFSQLHNGIILFLFFFFCLTCLNLYRV